MFKQEHYKYCIMEKLQVLPYSIFRERVTEIAKACNISRHRFVYVWCRIPINSKKDIPAQKLDIIASQLGYTADELKNYKTNTDVR